MMMTMPAPSFDPLVPVSATTVRIRGRGTRSIAVPMLWWSSPVTDAAFCFTRRGVTAQPAYAPRNRSTATTSTTGRSACVCAQGRRSLWDRGTRPPCLLYTSPSPRD